MTRRADRAFRVATIAVAAFPLFACSPEPGTASGTVVNGRGGAPLSGVALRLSTPDDACPPVTVTTDGSGRWSASDLCGKAAWSVAPLDPDWYLPSPAPAANDLLLRVWRAPELGGVYLVDGEAITPVVTNTVLDTVRVFGTDREVRFPVEIPGALPHVGGNAALLVVGDVLGGAPRFEPLVASDERRWFGSKDAPLPIDPWVYLGVRFSSDTEVATVDAGLKADAVETVEGARTLRYVPAGALAPGRYALPTPDGARAFLVEFTDG